jgi:hypothetical protein
MLPLIALPLLGLSLWLIGGTFRRLQRKRAAWKWWLAYCALVVIGAIVGWRLAMDVEYQVSPTMRFASFPIPLAFFHLENGEWIDFILPPAFVYLGLAANVLSVVAAALAPLLILSLRTNRNTRRIDDVQDS